MWKGTGKKEGIMLYSPQGKMIIRKINPKIILILFFFLSLIKISAEEKIRLDVQVSNQRPVQGETIVYQLTVKGDFLSQDPLFPQQKNFKVNFQGGQTRQSQSVSIVNWKQKVEVIKEHIFTWQLKALKTGNFVIGPLTVKHKGKTYKSSQISLYVKKPGEVPNYKLFLETDQQSIFPGQALTLRLVWALGANVHSYQADFPLLDNPNWHSKAIQNRQQGSAIRFVINQQQTQAYKEERQINGQNMTCFILEWAASSSKTGIYNIEPATFQFEGVVGYKKERDFFDRMVRKERTESFVIQSNSLKIEVRPLPKQGQPAGFSGLLGPIKARMQAAPQKVHEGDPITLTIILENYKNFTTPELPLLADIPALNEHFLIPKEQSQGKEKNGAYSFTQTLRAKNADIDKIPSFNLPFYDVQKQKYADYKLSALPITVLPVKMTGAESLHGADGKSIIQKKELEEQEDGIYSNFYGATLFQKKQLGFRQKLTSSPAWIVFFAALLFFFTALALRLFQIYSGRLKADAWLNFQQFCRNKELSSLESDKKLEAYADAVLHFFRGRSRKLPPSADFSQIADFLDKNLKQEDLKQESREILIFLDSFKYAGVPVGNTAEKRISQIENWIKQTDKSL